MWYDSYAVVNYDDSFTIRVPGDRDLSFRFNEALPNYINDSIYALYRGRSEYANVCKDWFHCVHPELFPWLPYALRNCWKDWTDQLFRELRIKNLRWYADHYHIKLPVQMYESIGNQILRDEPCTVKIGSHYDFNWDELIGYYFIICRKSNADGCNYKWVKIQNSWLNVEELPYEVSRHRQRMINSINRNQNVIVNLMTLVELTRLLVMLCRIAVCFRVKFPMKLMRLIGD